MTRKGGAFFWAALATLLFATWQQITVIRNFSGNWTALFCTGSTQPIPPSLRQGTYVVPNPSGYDGQMYRYVAHDPSLTGEAHHYLDNAPLRGRRILIPALAWFLAFGRQGLIDFAFISLFFAACFAGTYWTALYLKACAVNQKWSLLFLAIPATIIATDRLVIDMPSSALAAGVVWYANSGNRRMLFLMLLLSCLCRETGLIFAAGFVGSALFERQWRNGLLFAASAIPAFAWYGYVQLRLGRVEIPDWVGKAREVGPLKYLLHPVSYPFRPPMAEIAQWLDRVAILGLLLAFALAIVFGLRHWKGPVHLSALLFAASAAATLDPRFWEIVHGFARPYSPLLVVLAMHAAVVNRYQWLWILPIALMDGRIGFQLTPQIFGLFGLHIAS